MARKIKKSTGTKKSAKVTIAMNWAAACGGCDVSILDLEQGVLDVAAIAEFVYWPVAMDFKRHQLQARPSQSVDIGIFNGAVRTSEQEEDALLLRDKCKVLVAFGSCACYGGIPGLANVSDRAGVFQTAYQDTAGTDNPTGIEPAPVHQEGEALLELPRFHDRVKALHQVTRVDLFAPGCPPATARIMDLVGVIKAVKRGAKLPPPGSFLASDKGLCQECPRGGTRGSHSIESFKRPHLTVIDPELCLLDQGIACMGIATRGGCGAPCISANMPCRGCYGPLPNQIDPAVELLSALAVLAGPRGNWDIPAHQILNPPKTLEDPLGTLYRFTYPVSVAQRTIRDQKVED